MFAVKVFDDCGDCNDYVVYSVHRSLEGARSRVRDLRDNLHRPFPLIAPKIVKITDKLVKTFESFGNFVSD